VSTEHDALEHEALEPDALEREARPRPQSEAERAIWNLAATVVDPEVPVLTIEDLGVLRGVTFATASGSVTVEITPTYSGCPAVDAMRDDIVGVLHGNGYDVVSVKVVLSPAWTTDWLSEEGRTKLEQYGIAAPGPRRSDGTVSLGLGIRCPRCGSMHTRELSRFGSTSCKALYVCQRCQEPFDYFKEH
jgi:ring-1,2-phenylacetyl-CoA epoxidase subunit PaaD